MSDLQQLPAQDRAVLSLVVGRSMTFEQIGARLRMDPHLVRERAHAAAIHLAAPPQGVDPLLRARLLDFVLGQSSVEALGPELRRPEMRRWTIALTTALAPLARQRPPELATPQPAAAASAAPAAPAAPRVAWRPRIPAAAGLALLALTVAVVVIVLIASSSSTSTPGTERPAPGPVPTTQLVRRMVLTPTAAAGSAVGAGAVIRRGTSLQLVLQAKGLSPNLGNSYAVWLFNNPLDSRLLGFVSPAVDRRGTFSSGVMLPADAIRFRLVVVTRETRPKPSAPGTAVFSGPLALS